MTNNDPNIFDKDKNDLAGQSLGDWQEMVYTLAKTKGWYDNPDAEAHKVMAELACQESVYLSRMTERLRQGDYSCAKPHTLVRASGRDTEQSIKLARLWLIASEVFEAIECVVKGEDSLWRDTTQSKPEGLGIELADVAIRLLDFCEAYQIPLENYMLVKHAYNESRPHRHGGKKV
jgi:NTP pyrophosphatase (non-canonical NTP hydrolase)